MPNYPRKTDRPRGRPFTEDELAQFRSLAANGMSQRDIAVVLDRSTGSIAGAVTRYEIKTHGGPGGRPSHKTQK